ncbi:FHA domain-containing protein [Roseateles sp. BYS87W]|uniref:FHA domain-containing protein n=1 Tax=Pelomonas baiyunensis TaxID=3299026 RepID=A0ABW7GTD4_9BURK
MDEQQGEMTAPVGVAPASAVVELLGRDGRAVLVQRVTGWPVRLGRSPGCDVVLDDPHLAPEHAELHLAPGGGVQLRLLPSVNGGAVAGRRLAAGGEAVLPTGGNFQLAGCALRLRTSADVLAPEQVMVVHPVRHWALLPLMLLSMLGFHWLDRWSAVDPDARWVDYVSPMLTPLAFMLGWAGLWSLASQIFQHRFPFAIHLRRVLLVTLVTQLLDWVLPAVAYAMSWPRLMAVEAFTLPVTLAVLMAWHSRLVWPGAQRVLNIGITSLLLLWLGLQVANRQEQQHLFGPPYLASLPPPALRVAPTQSTQSLIESLQPLKAELAKQARKDNDSLGEDDSGGE